MKNSTFRQLACRCVVLLLASWVCGVSDVGMLRAQTEYITVTGQVLDKTFGDPLIGASVVEKGTTNGMATDLNGNFNLKVKSDATIEISLIGYKTVTFKASAEKKTIVMEEDNEMLDEVVVVGYGVQKKVNLTGSVSAVGSEKIANRPVMNVTQALTGVAPGVRVTQSSGAPGEESMSIQVRGQGSFNNSSPLILVDGVVADMAPLNSDDIESISILKDASAAAIYGSRAANGVIFGYD